LIWVFAISGLVFFVVGMPLLKPYIVHGLDEDKDKAKFSFDKYVFDLYNDWRLAPKHTDNEFLTYTLQVAGLFQICNKDPHVYTQHPEACNLVKDMWDNIATDYLDKLRNSQLDLQGT
jgi:hypothetical protein